MSIDTTQNDDSETSTEDSTDLRFGKQSPDPEDACEGETHIGRPVVITAVGHRDDPLREAKVCSACQTVFDKGKWEDGRGVAIEGEGETLMRRTNVEQDAETDHRIPLGDVLDDSDVQVNHVGIQDGELLVTTEPQTQGTLPIDSDEQESR